MLICLIPSVLWRCRLGDRKGIRPVKNWGADLHMAQLMPLPLTVSCFSNIQSGFTSLVLAHLGSPSKRAVKWMCVCVCVLCWFVTAGWWTVSNTHKPMPSISRVFCQNDPSCHDNPHKTELDARQNRTLAHPAVPVAACDQNQQKLVATATSLEGLKN